MTQIRSMTQPVARRPGELGVHSLDHFNFVVPDVAQAEKFYGLFGLNTKEEDGKLALYTHGHPHRWGVVSEGPRKKFTYVSFGAFEDDITRFRANQLRHLGAGRLDQPAGATALRMHGRGIAARVQRLVHGRTRLRTENRRRVPVEIGAVLAQLTRIRSIVFAGRQGRRFRRGKGPLRTGYSRPRPRKKLAFCPACHARSRFGVLIARLARPASGKAHI